MPNNKITPDDESAYFFQSQNELEAAAKAAVQLADAKYQHSAYLYFIARFMVSIFEATVSAIPIQVWNEYRSALDHHMRYLTQEDSSELHQIHRMEGHLQRAVLDVCKLFTHRMLDQLEKGIKADTIEILRMVDSGRFYETLRTGIDKTTEHFAGVKTHDNTLGNEKETDESIIGEYLDVAFRAWNLFLLYHRARHDIETAAATYANIEKKTEATVKGEKESWLKRMFDDVTGHTLFAVLTFICGLLVSSFFK